MRVVTCSLMLACTPPADPSGFDWGLPEGVAPPPVPADNPMSAEKVELGRILFYDLRLSDGEQRACGVCHEQAKGFTDGFPRAVGAHGDLHRHNSLPIVNVGYREVLTWARPDMVELEEQLLVPLLGTDPVEMGMGDRVDDILELLQSDPEYAARFPAVFEDEDPFTLDAMARAIAAFERTVISVDSPWDRYRRGDPDAMEPAAERGWQLFSGRAGCVRCHAGDQLDGQQWGAAVGPPVYANLGLYDVDGEGSYPEGGEGLMAVTGEPADMGRFRAPSLRNVEYTYPYFHDGSSATLEDVVAVLAAGGRNTLGGPNVGDGRDNPYKDPRIQPLDLDAQDQADLVAFLRALSDPDFIEDERFADPFPEE